MVIVFQSVVELAGVLACCGFRHATAAGTPSGVEDLQAGRFPAIPADMTLETERPPGPRLRIRIHFSEAEMMGPGKAELLERIARTGSIAAAGREMGMSYKRAWMLIETLNAMFRAPVVESTRGGPGGGGAVLTGTGQQVLALFRAFEAQAATAGAGPLAEMQALMRDIPGGK
ncbi:LysR family transcriptional regulator [Paracoccaceae bacterium Fryx2]|nr:LysR family transcriptional regulator [Paracoccaceae bacterium Fryx2]